MKIYTYTEYLLKECDCMGKAIVAMITSLVLGIIGAVLNKDFGLNIPDLGAILSIVTMGTFIIYFNDKKK